MHCKLKEYFFNIKESSFDDLNQNTSLFYIISSNERDFLLSLLD